MRTPIGSSETSAEPGSEDINGEGMLANEERKLPGASTSVVGAPGLGGGSCEVSFAGLGFFSGAVSVFSCSSGPEVRVVRHLRSYADLLHTARHALLSSRTESRSH